MDIFILTNQEILERISRHCPDAMYVYLQCINRANKDGNIYFTKEFVEVDLSDDWHPFKNKIKKLARENLLEWHPFDQGISVTLAVTDENE